MPPNCPLIESKRTLFLKNRHMLTPYHHLRELHLTSKSNLFLHISLVAHVRNTIIRVAPQELEWSGMTRFFFL